MGARKCGGQEVWEPGSVGARKCGGQEVWGPGSVGARYDDYGVENQQMHILM